MVLITTTKNIFIIQAIKSMRWRGFSYVKVIAVDDYSSLIRDFGTSCFRDEQSLLLPVFPDNDSTTCIRSLYFIHQWLKSQPVNIPCLAWGDNGVVSNKGIPFIPWKLIAEQFC
ncbi:TPA: LuxR family transcriptional regulator, partial [Escherichia coli]